MLVYPEIPRFREQAGFFKLVRPVPTFVQFFVSFVVFKLQHLVFESGAWEEVRFQVRR